MILSTFTAKDVRTIFPIFRFLSLHIFDSQAKDVPRILSSFSLMHELFNIQAEDVVKLLPRFNKRGQSVFSLLSAKSVTMLRKKISFISNQRSRGDYT